MDARNNSDRKNFVTSGAGDLVYEQAQYYARSYHALPIRVDEKLERYFYLFSEPQFKLKQKWIAKSYDFFSKGLVNQGYKMFGSKDYTGCIAVTNDFRSYMIEQAISDGAEQVLLMGGASPYAVIHHKNHQNVQFFQVSYGDSFRIQQEALAALRDDVYPNHKAKAAANGLREYACKGENMHYINADFTKSDLPAILIEQGFDPAKKTICSMPATTYYTSDELAQMFATVKALLSPNSQLINLIIPPPNRERRTKAGIKVGNKYGADYKEYISAEASPLYLFDRGFSMVGQFPSTSIHSAAGLTEAEVVSSNPQQNIYISRPKTEIDILLALSDVPVIKFDWRGEETAVVKNTI
jgi:hypothetical protein